MQFCKVYHLVASCQDGRPVLGGPFIEEAVAHCALDFPALFQHNDCVIDFGAGMTVAEEE